MSFANKVKKKREKTQKPTNEVDYMEQVAGVTTQEPDSSVVDLKEARQKAEEDAAQKKAEEVAAQKKAEEVAAQKKAEEVAARQKAKEVAAQKKAEEDESKGEGRGPIKVTESKSLTKLALAAIEEPVQNQSNTHKLTVYQGKKLWNLIKEVEHNVSKAADHEYSPSLSSVCLTMMQLYLKSDPALIELRQAIHDELSAAE